MIKQIRPAFYHNKRDSQYCCLSTDIIPDYLENGDEVYFIDTGKKYVYDSVSGQLYEKPSGGGGGTSVYPYDNNPEALGQEANPGTSDNYSRGDHIHPLPSVSDLGALPVGNIANEFSTSSTYAVGDYVIYEGQLYQCTTAVTTAGSWNSSNWVQAILGNDVSDLKSTLDTIVRSGAVNDTASGSIASFADGADNIPVKDLTVGVEPVQDLHGYSYPWPAGGGKNKFNGTFLQGYWAYADGTWINSPNWITTEKIPCKASTSYTVSADAKLTRWQGFVWYDSNGNFISTDNLNSSVNIGLTKTSPSNAAYLIFNIAGYPASSDTIAPSDVTHFQLEEGSSSTAWESYSNICPISGWTGANVYHSGADTSDATTYSITFPAAAGTVYGGTLDVTTGKLTVTMGYVDLGAKNWYLSTAAGRTRFRTSITDIERISSPNVVAPMLCSAYKTETANNTYTGKQGISLQQNATDVYVYDAQRESMTTADFKTAMSGVQLVYKLATPQTYQLTPTEVTTLLGENNIWADCGDSTVNYRADTKLYIDKKISAPANPASGQYLSWNGSAWVAASLPVYNGGVV